MWQKEYQTKLKTAEEAIQTIRSGQRVFVGSSCGEPQGLVNTLLLQKDRFSDLEILRLLSLEGSITALYADQTYGHNFSVRSIYQGSGRTEHLSGGKRFLTPMNISEIPRLFRSRQLPIHFALIQVSPPDPFGYVSLGISVDITLAAARAADVVIAQVNPKMPMTFGQGFLHIHEIDMFVEREEDLLTVLEFPEEVENESLVKQMINLIDDGSTFQLGLGEATQAILKALSEKNDLGLHTQYMTDGIMKLILSGNISNRYKRLNEGKGIASTAIGTEALYQFLDHNPCLEFHPSDYVHNPALIAQNSKMVSINVATAIDLTGQVAADALPQNHFSGVTGMIDFVHGAIHGVDGKSIMVIPSRTPDGQKSRIVPELDGGSVVIPRSHVHYVVTEFGVVNLFGKNLQERAMAMISLAAPDFREGLFEKAKELGLIGPERTFRDSLYGVYPAHLEEVKIDQGVKVTFRPVKTTDLRLIQEHFYNMEIKDIISRFFQERVTFYQDQMETMTHIDYIHNLSLVAVVEAGEFEKVIGLGEYFLESGKRIAEVAFSVSKDWQGKGIGRMLIKKLAEAAHSNGVSGLVAYTLLTNRPMIQLFKGLPYQVNTTFDGDMLTLTCKFNEK